MRILTAVALAASFAARYPQSGTLDSVLAGDGTLGSVEAGAVKSFGHGSLKLQYVKATEHFFQSGEVVSSGDYVQVTEKEARQLVAAGRAVLATDAEVAAAQAPVGKAK